MKNFIKRFMDILISTIGLIILSPVYIILMLIIKTRYGSPVIYTQTRIGKKGRKFNLHKFRTMEKNAEDMIKTFSPKEKEEYEENFKLRDDYRVTKLGKYLRKTSLDELPQLFNILKGDMSLIGPRPIVEKELVKYGEKKEKLLSVRPGLTGYWQAYATKDTTYSKRIEMELYYIENQSIMFDIKIFFKTIITIINKAIKKIA